MKTIITCEHGGNAVPQPYQGYFKGKKSLLASHRGYDRGALKIAEVIASALNAEFHFSLFTRLLVDLNRSPGNPRRFSEITSKLPMETKSEIMDTYYHPYLTPIESSIARHIGNGEAVIHISVHTFTPLLHGKPRFADIGLLYDPSRLREKDLCRRLKDEIRKRQSTLKVRMNYPYRGISDGLTSFFRNRYRKKSYIGIELEVNQSSLTSPIDSRSNFLVILHDSFLKTYQLF